MVIDKLTIQSFGWLPSFTAAVEQLDTVEGTSGFVGESVTSDETMLVQLEAMALVSVKMFLVSIVMGCSSSKVKWRISMASLIYL